jgi:hypothetical protein
MQKMTIRAGAVWIGTFSLKYQSSAKHIASLIVLCFKEVVLCGFVLEKVYWVFVFEPWRKAPSVLFISSLIQHNSCCSFLLLLHTRIKLISHQVFGYILLLNNVHRHPHQVVARS